jgi:hypothetical protein
MIQNFRGRSKVQRRMRISIGIVIPATAVAVALILTTSSSQASSKYLTQRSEVSATACSSYLNQATASEVSASDSATLSDAYPTTASDLLSWLQGFDPMADPAALQTLSPSADVDACILQGNWVLPAGGGGGTNAESYEVVVIAPDGTGTPVLWGSSALSSATAPLVGKS